MPKSEFPIVETIKNMLDPFTRLFNTVSKWQRNEKKWTDGSFTDLNGEVVEGECEEFWREIYKIQKQFMTIIKKRKLELQTKLGERKKKSNTFSFRNLQLYYLNMNLTSNLKEKIEDKVEEEGHAQPEVVEEKDEDEKELEKLEKGDPEMIKICNTIMTQLDEFKVIKYYLNQVSQS